MDLTADQFSERLSARARDVENVLRELLDGTALPGERVRPGRLVEAMRHGVLNGGKRMRPALVMESAALLGGDPVAAARVGAALECVHCYSLIHDDLPAMDDDDLRRGQPTVHIAFDEATAILAGDSLLTLAFDCLADPATPLPAERRIELVLALSRASGLGGMAGGQSLDLQAERDAPGETGIIDLQAMKTGALIRFACEAGAILSGADTIHRTRLIRFGEIIGLAFQLRDDLLDLTADAKDMGKATGKDAARGKATLVSLHGIDNTVRRLGELTAEAESLLKPYGSDAAMLLALARHVANRQN